MPSDRPSKPHGTFTPAATIALILVGAGYKPFAVRSNVGQGGHRCTWDKDRRAVRIVHRCGDGQDASERDELLTAYWELLTSKGYVVSWISDRSALIVKIT